MEISLDQLLDRLGAAIEARDRRTVRELLREACFAAEMAAIYLDSWTTARRDRLLKLASEATDVLRGTPDEERAANLAEKLPDVAA